MNDLISIIIPAYNNEMYFAECLQSACNQSYVNLEVIVVIDGSTDDSLAIAKAYQFNDNRILIFVKENGGQSSARNMGLDKANGKYIFFFDADDVLDKNVVEELYRISIENNADISVGKIKSFVDEVKFKENYASAKIELMNDKDLIMNSFFYNKKRITSACSKLFKRELFNDINFCEGIIHEDDLLMYNVIKICNTIVLTDYEGYYYRVHSLSTTHSKFTIKRLDKIFVYKSILDDINTIYPSFVTLATRRYIGAILYGCIQMSEDKVKYNVRLREYYLELKKYKKFDSYGIKLLPFYLSVKLSFEIYMNTIIIASKVLKL